MGISETLVEAWAYEGDGYRPLVDYGTWRVALLRAAEDMLPEKIERLQRHDGTDEVFVLLQGRCILYIAEGDESVSAIHGQDMVPLTVYNVKRGVWHNHALSADAVVLIVENRDTDDQNSPFLALNDEQRMRLIELKAALWENEASAAGRSG